MLDEIIKGGIGHKIQAAACEASVYTTVHLRDASIRAASNSGNLLQHPVMLPPHITFHQLKPALCDPAKTGINCFNLTFVIL
ncbi:MAG: hypothetical protein C5S49_01490 [Candidatus Methanogaster sp.]|nr:MAG: hypothetical protein C5S49_01490 [ANME-2 cluster archaeon]